MYMPFVLILVLFFTSWLLLMPISPDNQSLLVSLHPSKLNLASLPADIILQVSARLLRDVGCGISGGCCAVAMLL